MNRDLVELLTALTLIGACAGIAISTAAPPRGRSEPELGETPRPGRSRRARRPSSEARSEIEPGVPVFAGGPPAGTLAPAGPQVESVAPGRAVSFEAAVGMVAEAAPFEAAVAAVAVTDPTRPRIFTGEPAPPEAGRPATLRALKLVGGLTALAAVGAVALLALVRAMVAMFQRIGG